MRMRWMIPALAVIAGLGVTSCSSDDDGTESNAGDDPTTTVPVERPDGPAAEVTGPIEGGKGLGLIAGASLPDLEAAGYTEVEYRVAGTATSYQADDLPADGTYELEPNDEAEYATRIVVRRPADAADFNGTVLVEWLNVSSGLDAAPDYTYLAEEIVRGGYAWVGVSAQHIGVEGGPVAVSAPVAEDVGAGRGLRTNDPERYGDLTHPGDGYSYDLYTQVGRMLRAGDGDGHPLEGLDVERLLAIGESQSAFTLTTYANGVQPLARQFDGFLIHSRGGPAAPLGGRDSGIGIADALGSEPTTIRTDLDVPTMIVQAEGDVIGLLNFLPARQEDTDRIRLWEIAGAAHADTFQVGAAAPMLGCPQPINSGQQYAVIRAALRHLDTWAAGGDAPPEAERLEVDESGAQPVFVKDEDGNVRGGVRTPAVDAPVDVLSGAAPEGASVICLLLGSTTPIPTERLATLYPTRDDYVAAYEEALDAAVDAGFVLDDDRPALLDDADPDRIPG